MGITSTLKNWLKGNRLSVEELECELSPEDEKVWKMWTDSAGDTEKSVKEILTGQYSDKFKKRVLCGMILNSANINPPFDNNKTRQIYSWEWTMFDSLSSDLWGYAARVICKIISRGKTETINYLESWTIHVISKLIPGNKDAENLYRIYQKYFSGKPLFYTTVGIEWKKKLDTEKREQMREQLKTTHSVDEHVKLLKNYANVVIWQFPDNDDYIDFYADQMSFILDNFENYTEEKIYFNCAIKLKDLFDLNKADRIFEVLKNKKYTEIRHRVAHSTLSKKNSAIGGDTERKAVQKILDEFGETFEVYLSDMLSAYDEEEKLKKEKREIEDKQEKARRKKERETLLAKMK